MSGILAISSFVGHGTVGLRAVGPALGALGRPALQLPTILLSNHPGHARFERTDIAPETLGAILSALDDNGWLADVGGVLTGYLPTAEHVRFACHAVDLVKRRSPGAVFICDPIIGDDPGGLYLPETTAVAIRDTLLPKADLATPNRFELSWLGSLPVEDVPTAEIAARALCLPGIVATSIPDGGAAIANVLVSSCTRLTHSSRKLDAVPHGTGDLLAALLAGLLVCGKALPEAFELTSLIVVDVANKSDGCALLNLSPLTRIAGKS